jgi:hypothetical protein
LPSGRLLLTHLNTFRKYKIRKPAAYLKRAVVNMVLYLCIVGVPRENIICHQIFAKNYTTTAAWTDIFFGAPEKIRPYW